MRRCECGEIKVDRKCPKCETLRKPARRGRLHREGKPEPGRGIFISSKEARRGLATAGVRSGSTAMPQYIWPKS